MGVDSEGLPVRLPIGSWVVISAFLVSGTVHQVRPKVFYPLVPRFLPARKAIVHASGVAELACAAGLMTRQPWAPPASAGLLLGLWTGNVTMAITWQASERVGPAAKAAAWARLPVQVPLMVWAWRSPRSN